MTVFWKRGPPVGLDDWVRIVIPTAIGPRLVHVGRVTYVGPHGVTVKFNDGRERGHRIDELEVWQLPMRWRRADYYNGWAIRGATESSNFHDGRLLIDWIGMQPIGMQPKTPQGSYTNARGRGEA